MKLNSALLPHQEEAVEKLRRLKVGALYMEQGTGKTITALELCRLRMEAGKVERVVWLCPCSIKNGIREEVVRHAPREMLSRTTICGIETLSSSIRANVYLRSMVEAHKCYLVVDESLLVKNHSAKRTKNITHLAERCQYKLILNGTPISRDEVDLYAQFRILDWRILGYKTFWSFAANHIEYDRDIPDKVVGLLNTKYIADRIRPYAFEVKKSDCLELPEKTYHKVEFELTDEQYDHYCETADKLLLEVDEYRPETVYRFLSAMQAIISGKRVVMETESHYRTEEFFSDPLENPRMQALKSCITEEKTIIYCSYTSEIEAACRILDGAVPFYGASSQRERAENLRRFRESEECRRLVANRACASYGLNLQFCRNVVYCSNSWDLGTRLQSEDRVHRIGQARSVHITDIVAMDTIDERIRRCLNRKEDVLENIKSRIKGDKKDAWEEWLCISQKKRRGRGPAYNCLDLLEEQEE